MIENPLLYKMAASNKLAVKLDKLVT